MKVLSVRCPLIVSSLVVEVLVSCVLRFNGFPQFHTSVPIATIPRRRFYKHFTDVLCLDAGDNFSKLPSESIQLMRAMRKGETSEPVFGHKVGSGAEETTVS